MSEKTFACPSCGATLEIQHRFSKVVICVYCGQTSAISSSGLKIEGRQAELLDLDSILSLGAEGDISGTPFKVLGCLRYEYEDGFWDEWFIRLDDKRSIWLQEDEGEFTMFEKETLTSAVDSFGDIRVGQNIEVNGIQVFVTEKNQAEIKGGMGELHFRISPGAQVNCVDGNAGGRIVSLEFTPNEINLSIGDEISVDDISLNSSS